MDEPPLHDIQSVNPDGTWVLIILVPTLLMVHRTILKECGMPTCKRSIMPKTCMLHEATWKHVSNSNPCAHWFCWPRFPWPQGRHLPHHHPSESSPSASSCGSPSCGSSWPLVPLMWCPILPYCYGLVWCPASRLVWCPAYVLKSPPWELGRRWPGGNENICIDRCIYIYIWRDGRSWPSRNIYIWYMYIYI